MAAVLLERAGRCQLCGSAEWEWAEDPDAWVAQQVVCLGCAAKDRAKAAADAAKSSGDTTSVPGASIRLVRGAVAAAMSSVKAKRPKSRRELAREAGS